ncbi:hypothetical protein ACH4SK_10305 [Streptomyces inhibens]|uniref:hypothetical protein n=1 Tax=Streptomyces inhibens TaxID=2293571 RepID=UPI0037A4D6CF
MTHAPARPPQPVPYDHVSRPVGANHVTTATAPRIPAVHPPAQKARDRKWWCPPLIALSVVASLYLPAFSLLGFATMATDSCGPDSCPDSVMVPLKSAPYLYLTGIGLALLSCVFPWNLRWRTPRIALAIAGAAVSASVVPLLLTVFF